MTDSTESDSLGITALLERWSKGEKDAYDQLPTLLYGDIHAIAVRQLHREHYLTIRPTALVHEVYLRLSELRQMQWQDRAHFLSMAARVTRQALVDEARAPSAEKRDGGRAVTLSDTNLGVAKRPTMRWMSILCYPNCSNSTRSPPTSFRCGYSADCRSRKRPRC